MKKEDFLKLDNQLCFRLYHVSRQMTKVYQPLLKEFDLTYPQYLVMLVLFEENRIDFKDLSKRLDLKTGTLTPIIQNLEKLGYLRKEKQEDDKRKVDVCITDKGQDLYKSIIKVPLGLSKILNMTEDDYKSLVYHLDELSSILGGKQ
jgi:DNA-binding MarR family transcriptional regulator